MWFFLRNLILWFTKVYRSYKSSVHSNSRRKGAGLRDVTQHPRSTKFESYWSYNCNTQHLFPMLSCVCVSAMIGAWTSYCLFMIRYILVLFLVFYSKCRSFFPEQHTIGSMWHISHLMMQAPHYTGQVTYNIPSPSAEQFTHRSLLSCLAASEMIIMQIICQSSLLHMYVQQLCFLKTGHVLLQCSADVSQCKV